MINNPGEKSLSNLSIIYSLKKFNHVRKILHNQSLWRTLTSWDYFPRINAPNARPSKSAAMMIIAVWILAVASG